MRAHRRAVWALFAGVSALAVGACSLAALAAGGRSDVGLVLLGGFVAVGIAAAFLASVLSPLPDGGSGRLSLGPQGFVAGGFGGGDGGGGDCGGGAGDCG